MSVFSGDPLGAGELISLKSGLIALIAFMHNSLKGEKARNISALSKWVLALAIWCFSMEHIIMILKGTVFYHPLSLLAASLCFAYISVYCLLQLMKPFGATNRFLIYLLISASYENHHRFD